jgi:hypothetical protein
MLEYLAPFTVPQKLPIFVGKKTSTIQHLPLAETASKNEIRQP